MEPEPEPEPERKVRCLRSPHGNSSSAPQRGWALGCLLHLHLQQPTCSSWRKALRSHVRHHHSAVFLWLGPSCSSSDFLAQSPIRPAPPLTRQFALRRSCSPRKVLIVLSLFPTFGCVLTEPASGPQLLFLTEHLSAGCDGSTPGTPACSVRSHSWSAARPTWD